MTARTDLANALQFLDDGIAAHVAALAAARKLASDDTMLVDVTTKINELADTLMRSTAQV